MNSVLPISLDEKDGTSFCPAEVELWDGCCPCEPPGNATILPNDLDGGGPGVGLGDGLDIDAGAVLGTDTGEGTFDSLASVPYTFTYPDLLQFNIFVSNPNQSAVTGGISGDYQRVFTSRLCAIIDLNVQYGSNRINFVKSDGGSVSYPSEVAISLALKEVEFNTSHEAIQEASDSNRTIR